MSPGDPHPHPHPQPARDDGVPVCRGCFAPVVPGADYCATCGSAVGQFTEYVPFVNLRWQASGYDRLSRSTWGQGGGVFARTIRLFVSFALAPVLLLRLLKRQLARRGSTKMLLPLLGLLLAACDSGSPPSWSPLLGADELARCEQVAWDAARSPQVWARFGMEQEFGVPADLSQDGIRTQLDPQDLGRVQVKVPDGELLGWHRTYVEIVVARDTHEVLGLSEGVWW